MYAPPYTGSSGTYYYSDGTPMSSPMPANTPFYSPRHSTMPATPSRSSRGSHSRRASLDPGAYHASPRHYAQQNYPPTTGFYSSPGMYPSAQFVSRSSRSRARYAPWDDHYYSSSDEHSSKRSSRRAAHYDTHYGDGYTGYDSYESSPRADVEYVPVAEPRSERSRRSSHSSRAPPKMSSSKPAEEVPPPRPAPKATAADAARHNIPAGYSIKNWDPTEDPIILLGSVFDANSLGKWIYDWTVYHYSATSDQAETAGQLWLSMIQVAGKKRRAEETVSRVRQEDRRELVEDFIESGERLWDRFRALLKACETFMMRAAKRESAAKKEGKESVKMSKASGVEFVETVFGPTRELHRTEKLMAAMRMWNMRFDANVEEILKRPSA